MKTEPEITRDVMKAIKRLGGPLRFTKIVAGDAQEAGISDLLGCCHGRFVAVEMKRPKYDHKLSALQALYLDQVERSGGYAAVCASVEEVMAVIDAVASGAESQWREQADIRAFPGRDRSFPGINYQ